MKLYADQLARHFQSGKLMPGYWLAGDEPLQMRDCADIVRQTTKTLGYTEREVYEADRQFDWRTLTSAGASMSLFSDKKLIELRLGSSKIADADRKLLIEYLKSAPEDTLLLILSPRIEGAATKTQWYKQLESLLGVVQLYPVEASRLPAWITQRLSQRQLSADADACQLLADRVEGNMLAADQEIEKLSLLFGSGTHLDAAAIARSVADSSRFNVFALIDACLAGEGGKAIRTLRRMRDEGAQALMINTMLARELRTLHGVACQMQRGLSAQSVMQSQRVWKSRQALMSSALNRLSEPALRNQLTLARQIDISVKGLTHLSAWELLEQLVARLSGRALKLPSDSRWQ
ncbi:DNA polymerase III subunit delta [Pseudohongiella sp. SYSU M77423]|uniref:DNA polymerase III subunit delta n=1 Tax=Pseudohongiella sp. SYSU M77423 TaxID=3042312 RepID=UPI0024808007|nr:DNA polymerase III subunit delta [Pseudohongiella sp. SYSU M77423]MDH7944472.1 DNA polymerase III subunit delta [Pseudohongiella sp. SYSU M77423]